MSSDTYRVTIVKYGERSTHKSDVYLNHHIYGQDDDPIGMDYFFWVIQNVDRTIIVDTGFSKHGGEVRNRTFGIDPVRLRGARRRPGCRTRRRRDPRALRPHRQPRHFPEVDARHRRARTLLLDGPLAKRKQFHHSVEDVEIAALVQANEEGRVRTYEGLLELAPGVTLLELGGHTPGLSVVLVKTSEGPVLLASDSMHYYEELERDMPFAFVADLPAMYSGFDTITDLVDSGRVAHLVSGHDPDTLARFTAVTEGELAGIAATIGTLD